ncbi:MAG: ribonuclease HII [Deltaproteobacteria bacterium]|nr:ribonuclease HII [Deltaproteobacteria bacterium]
MPPSQRWGEIWAARSGYRLVAGVDEAGRGPLAGPVVAAAVVLPPGHGIDGIGDSKLLSARRREELYSRIKKTAKMAVCRVEAERIDQVNVLRATMEAMAGAIKKLTRSLGREPDCVLIDGPHKPGLHLLGARLNCVPVVKGDRLSENIGAASIVAKVTRDRLMKRFDRKFRGYGFARHKGYGTPEHLAALEGLGPCEIHRRTFAGVLGRRAEQESR